MSIRPGFVRLPRYIILVFGATAIAACGSSPTQPTSTNSTASTSTVQSSSTTTSVLPTTAGVRYIGTFAQQAPAPALPLDLSLFFSLQGGAVAPSALRPRALYQVTGG